MSAFNVDGYRLAFPSAYDPLFGKEALPEEIRARDLHNIKNPPRNRKDRAPINSALAGSRVRGGGRIRGGTFAPRATSGTV